MNYSDNLQALRKFLSIKENAKGLKHNINNKNPILPFRTRNPERAKFKDGFGGVTGEFVRILNGNKITDEFSIEKVINQMIDKVEANEKDRPYFERLLRMFLSNDLKNMKVFHPYILQYIPLTPGNESKGEKDIAQFMRDVLLGNEYGFKYFFQKSRPDNLIAKLVLNQLNDLIASKTEKKYHPLLPYVTNVFNEDILFLTKHRDYFLENIHLFLAYYYFFYITQVSLKLSQMHKGDWNHVNKVVYTLDWESTSKSREGYKLGYRNIKDISRKILVHVNCLEHINYIFDTPQASTYPHLKNYFETLSNEQRINLIDLISDWIKEYRYHTSLDNIQLNYDYESLILDLFNSLDEGIAEETKSRYALSIEEIGKRYFLKTRGNLGYMLNITQEFLLLLTTISVKDKRMPLKDVFIEFEKRGVFLDRHSKEAVVELFDKINVLDKKSDSGDAQYVKPIL